MPISFLHACATPLLALWPFSLLAFARDTAGGDAAPTSIGFIFTGGGSFGAFEAGALKAFFDRWARQHGGAPPIRVIAGTSTGALIAPFVAFGLTGVTEVADLYRNSNRDDILSARLADLLPFALFSKWSPSAFGAEPLRKTLLRKLPDAKVNEIAGMWPALRLAVATTDFTTGSPARFSNSPEDMAAGAARFRDGVLASAMSPLATPPVSVRPDSSTQVETLLDGGVYSVAPFPLFFDLAGRPPAIDLDQVVVFSAYPLFPGQDSNAVQHQPFPAHPGYGAIGNRMDSLSSEASVTKELRLAWAAIDLRAAGRSVEQVKERTGLYIPRPPRELMLIAPEMRLGWNDLRFDKKEMRKMFDLGYQAVPRRLISVPGEKRP